MLLHEVITERFRKKCLQPGSVCFRKGLKLERPKHIMENVKFDSVYLIVLMDLYYAPVAYGELK